MSTLTCDPSGGMSGSVTETVGGHWPFGNLMLDFCILFCGLHPRIVLDMLGFGGVYIFSCLRVSSS